MRAVSLVGRIEPLRDREAMRGRLRMVLEAVEDHLRGWRDGKTGLGGERVTRGKLHIEHVMPRKWATHWPLADGSAEIERDRWIHTLGNLTLLNGPLNAKVSNGPWLGETGKRQGLQAHDVLVMNRQLLKTAASDPAERLNLWRKVLGENIPVDQLAAAIAICARYDLDPVLRHVIVFKTEQNSFAVILSRDALLHIAHRSGAFDGMEVDDPHLEKNPITGEQEWVARATVHRKDMAHPFTQPGRFPVLRTRAVWERRAGQNVKVGERREPHPYGPEMAIKRAEARALRRAFSVAIGAGEELGAAQAAIRVEDDDWTPEPPEPPAAAALAEPAPEPPDEAEPRAAQPAEAASA